MSALTRPRPAIQVLPPTQPVVEPLGTHGLGEVAQTAQAARCHCTATCLAPLCVGELVVATGGPFYALLEHIEGFRDRRRPRPPLRAVGVPRRI